MSGLSNDLRLYCKMYHVAEDTCALLSLHIIEVARSGEMTSIGHFSLIYTYKITLKVYMPLMLARFRYHYYFMPMTVELP